MTPDPIVVTNEDVTRFNRDIVTRAANYARLVATGLVVVGAIGVAGWLWLEVRVQQLVSMRGDIVLPGSDRAKISAVERIDAFANSLVLLILAVLAAGFGVAVRLVADYTASRIGATLTGFEPGDVIPDEDDAERNVWRPTTQN